MLCRCLSLPPVQAKARRPAEIKPILGDCSPSEEFKSTLSAPAALTSFGVRGAICGSRLFEIKTMAFAGRIHISPAQRLHEASAQGRCSTEGATPSHPTPGIVQHAKQSASRKPSFWPSAAGVRDSTVRRAEPLAQAERQRQAPRARPEVRGTFSQSGPWRPAVVARLARTLSRLLTDELGDWF